MYFDLFSFQVYMLSLLKIIKDVMLMYLLQILIIDLFLIYILSSLRYEVFHSDEEREYVFSPHIANRLKSKGYGIYYPCLHTMLRIIFKKKLKHILNSLLFKICFNFF